MERFLTKGTEYKIDPKTIIFKAGEPFDPDKRAVYYVISGRVNLARRLKDGRLVVRAVKAGEVFGTMEAFQEKPREFTAISAAPSHIYGWTRSNYELIVGTYAEVAKSSITNLSSILRHANQLLQAFQSAEPPMGKLLEL